MTHSKKTINLPVYIIVIMLISSACTRAPSPEQFSSSTPASSIIEAESVTITFAASEDERGFYEQLMSTFHEENPDIIIQFVALPEGQADSSTNTNYFQSIAAAADTSLLWSSRSALNKTGNYFRDLQPLMEADATFDERDFWPPLLSACENLEGSILGIPLTIHLTGIFYDPQAFDLMGLPYPQPGWTVSDFQQAAATLSRPERYGFADRSYLSGSILAPFVDAYLISNNGEVDAEQLTQELTWYFNLVEPKALFPIREVDNNQSEYEQWVKMFEQSRPAMWIGSLSDPIPGDVQVSSTTDPLAGLAISKVGFVPFPVFTDGSVVNTTPAFVRCGVMSAGTQHPRESWKWLDFLSNRWLIQNKSIAYELLQVPARQSVANAEGFWNTLPIKAEPAVRYALEHAWYGSFYPQTIELIGNALVRVIHGNTDLTTALNGSDSQTPVSTPTPESELVSVATPKPTLSPDATVIDYFPGTFYPQELENIKVLLDEFHQTHPEIFVNMLTDQSFPPDRDWLSFLGGKYACFTWYAPFWSSQKSDELLSLNSLLDTEATQFKQDYNPSLLEVYSLDGTIYGLPAVSQPQMIAYNADLLAKRGLAIPSNDWTFDDFINLATSVASISDEDKSYGYVYDEWETFFLAGRGFKWADLTLDPPVAYFDSPQVVSGFSWLAELQRSRVILVRDIENWDAVDRAVAAGSVAFWPSNAGQPEGWYFGSGEPSYKIGIVPMPLISDTSNWMNTGLERGHYISRHAEDPQACWEWIKFLSEQSNGFLGVPARLSVAESPAWEAAVGSEFATAYRLAASRGATRFGTNDSEVAGPFYTWLGDALSAVLQGDDPQAVLATTQHKANSYLTCMSVVDTSKLTYDELQNEINACAKQVDPEGNWP